MAPHRRWWQGLVRIGCRLTKTRKESLFYAVIGPPSSAPRRLRRLIIEVRALRIVARGEAEPPFGGAYRHQLLGTRLLWSSVVERLQRPVAFEP